MYLASILIFNLNRLDELKEELLTVINNGNLLINQDYDFAYNGLLHTTLSVLFI